MKDSEKNLIEDIYTAEEPEKIIFTGRGIRVAFYITLLLIIVFIISGMAIQIPDYKPLSFRIKDTSSSGEEEWTLLLSINEMIDVEFVEIRFPGGEKFPARLLSCIPIEGGLKLRLKVEGRAPPAAGREGDLLIPRGKKSFISFLWQ